MTVCLYSPTEQRPYNVPWGDVICLSKWADTVTECPINVAKYDFFSISLRTNVWFVLWLHHVWKTSQSLFVKCIFFLLQGVIEKSIYRQQYKSNLCHVWLQGLGAPVFYWGHFLFLSKNYCQSQQVASNVSSHQKSFLVMMHFKFCWKPSYTLYLHCTDLTEADMFGPNWVSQ